MTQKELNKHLDKVDGILNKFKNETEITMYKKISDGGFFGKDVYDTKIIKGLEKAISLSREGWEWGTDDRQWYYINLSLFTHRALNLLIVLLRNLKTEKRKEKTK